METGLRRKLSEIVDLAREHYGLDFCKTPLSKSVVTVLGDQSSGKSSLINYFFNNEIRVTGASAIDTQFTILETVPEEEFIQICGNNYRGDSVPRDYLTEQRLKEPISRAKTDDRKNIVWTELMEGDKMNRYKQFYESNLRSVFTKYNNLVKAIVINEKYITGTELEQQQWQQKEAQEKQQQEQQQQHNNNSSSRQRPEQEGSNNNNNNNHSQDEDDAFQVIDLPTEKNRPLIKDLIIIDTPGFNDDSLSDPNKFQANIDVLEFFYAQSDIVLFLLSTDHMLSIGIALQMLQLTLLDPETKLKLFEQSRTMAAGDGGDRGASTGFIESMVRSAYFMVEKKMRNLWNYASSSAGVDVNSNYYQQQQLRKYYGANMYDKLYFVINKIDLCKNPSHAFYEFGCSIGRRFQHLPLPTVDHVLAIGVPMEQRRQLARVMSNVQQHAHDSNNHNNNNKAATTTTTNPYNIPLERLSIGQLAELEHVLQTLKEETHVQGKIISHIQYVFDKISEAHCLKMSMVGRYWKSHHFERAKQIAKLYGIMISTTTDTSTTTITTTTTTTTTTDDESAATTATTTTANNININTNSSIT